MTTISSRIPFYAAEGFERLQLKDVPRSILSECIILWDQLNFQCVLHDTMHGCILNTFTHLWLISPIDFCALNISGWQINPKAVEVAEYDHKCRFVRGFQKLNCHREAPVRSLQGARRSAILLHKD